MLSFLHSLFIPHHHNNQRARLAQNSTIFFFLIFFIAALFLSNFLVKNKPDILGISYSISDNELLVLVNNERTQNNLVPLNLNPELSDAARRKADDMFSKNYWAHFAPDRSSSPWGFIRAAGYNYIYAGENLAKGFTDSGSVVSGWMGSSTHRENILSPKFSDVGFAVVEGRLNGEETVLVVEMLGATGAPVARAESQETFQSPQKVAVVQEVNELMNTQEATTHEATSTSEVKFANLKNEVIKKPLIDIGFASRATSGVSLSFIAFAFLMDLVIIERRKIPRFVGHNIDHIMIIGLFLLLVLLKVGGVIL